MRTSAYLAVLFAALLAPGIAMANSDAEHPKEVHWQFNGPMGTVDKQAAQRGMQVYKEVCAACHSLKRVAFRKLSEIGFTEGEIKALAATYNYEDTDDAGQPKERPGKASDYFRQPFANEKAARAGNGGAFPPDLSLITKARVKGPDYLYSLLTGFGKTADYVCTAFSPEGNCTGYRLASDADRQNATAQEQARREAVAKAEKAKAKAPTFTRDSDRPDMIYACIPHSAKAEATPAAETEECNRLNAGMHYNPYFPGRQIAMPQPLSDGQVSYEDGTKASVDQMAKDVTVFLQWAAEPEMEARKEMGLKVIAFLLVMSVFFFFAYQRIWKDVH